MAIIDFIAVLISGGALAVSVVSLYFSLIYKKIALVGGLVAYKTESDEDAGVCELAFSLANTGNQELLIHEAAIDVAGSNEGRLVPELRPAQLPTVLGSGEIKVVIIHIPVRFMKTVAGANQKLKLAFNIFAPSGQCHVAAKNLNVSSEALLLSEDAWEPFSLRKLIK